MPKLRRRLPASGSVTAAAGGREAAAPSSGGAVAHVYVHAPFCARRCFYCDFAVSVRRSADPEEWVDAVRLELRLLEGTGVVELASALKTFYVGGGTPSLLGPGAMSLLARALGGDRLRSPGLEWTAEANPESLTPEIATAWRQAGVNRLSLGVQSFQESVLTWMGRLHGAEGARDSVARARDAGIENLSVDLIFGLPDTLRRDWVSELEAASSLEVPHISLYGLTAERGTPLGRGVANGTIRMADDESYRGEYLEAHRRLTAAGYRHYEISNFARPGFESRHNQAYWSGVPYLGLGNSAHSFFPPVRRGNLRDWSAYLEAVSSGQLPLEGEDHPGEAGARIERLWLALRTDAGMGREALHTSAARKLVRSWDERGLVHRDPDRVRMTVEGWLVLDSLVLELDRSLEGAGPGG